MGVGPSGGGGDWCPTALSSTAAGWVVVGVVTSLGEAPPSWDGLCHPPRPPNGHCCGHGKDLMLVLVEAIRPSEKRLCSVELPHTEEDREPVSSIAMETLASDTVSPSNMLNTMLLALTSRACPPPSPPSTPIPGDTGPGGAGGCTSGGTSGGRWGHSPHSQRVRGWSPG